MPAFVVDASVVVSLYVEEPVSDDARQALAAIGRANDRLHAPELLVIEIANALWKRVRRDDLPAAAAMTAIGQVAGAEIELHRLAELAPQALALGLAHGITAYDACYVALATRVGGTVLTGDRVLADRAEETGLPVQRIGR